MIQDLMDKLKVADGQHSDQQNTRTLPPLPKPPVKRVAVEDTIPRHTITQNLEQNIGQNNWNGIVLELGEGISLNVPIQRRMSLSDFLKIAEKVKALEMLNEEAEE